MSFEWKGATITARELVIADEERIAALLRALTGGTGEWTTTQYGWAEFIIGADVSGDAPLRMVEATDAVKVLQESYEAWRNLPRRFLRAWREEQANAEAPNE